MLDQSWIRSLHKEIQNCVFVLISTLQLPTLPFRKYKHSPCPIGKETCSSLLCVRDSTLLQISTLFGKQA